jgi:hypothetical protein
VRYINVPVITAGDASGNLTSSVIDASYLMLASVAVTSTSTAVGTVKLQASNDAPNTTPSIWTDIPSATAAISAAGTVLIPKTDIAYEYIRVVYTSTSGSGTLTARLKGTGF